MDKLASELEKEARSLLNNSHSNETVAARPQQPPELRRFHPLHELHRPQYDLKRVLVFQQLSRYLFAHRRWAMPRFTSTVVPFARRSTNDRRLSSSQSSDEFGVLGSSEAKMWRNIFRNDKTRIAGSRYKPLSRGYRFDVEPPRQLDRKKAVELLRQSVDAAATKVPLTPSEKKEIQLILQENSHECLEHVESEVRSRLLEDEDFDSDVYPSATSQFLAWADMPE
ncbi:hypothetical protein BWQ96_00657 [Gracilariopsis chorda]|uniref:Uncharacterized protein n=1 Tax=Gracilariopsis chorda TaxID=448386 RepID=A0A2V3J6G7_9FLOR|nr:hypothetical protein BWQ96_00657 [Gracilariopsis chorda]|eukprot:PXF49587.1 hypothetical protein BWQ96_00657 [Gracilariopsis chorda]